MKKVCLPAGEFEEFLRNPLENLSCIQEHVDLMKADLDGLYHCLLVTGEERRDGVLVESEGYGYARYVPDAAALEYDSLSEFGAGLSRLADRMILEGTSDTGDGNWVFYLDQIWEGCDFSFSENLALTELQADMLLERPEVSQASIRRDCLELRFYPDFCKNLQEGKDRAWRDLFPITWMTGSPGRKLPGLPVRTGRVKTGAACKKYSSDGSDGEWKGQGSRMDRKEERKPPGSR